MQPHLISMLLLGMVLAQSALADPYQLLYGGRITLANGQPIKGTVDLSVNFYPSGTGGSALSSQSFSAVPLSDGIFNITITLTPTEFNTTFNGNEAWIEITDITNGKVYPRQRFGAVPYAFKVPVDDETIGYNSSGKLMLKGMAGTALPTGTPSDGQVLKWRNSTGWEWGTDNTGGTPGTIDSTAIQDASISNVDIAANAAIAGTKVAPNFGSQNITTTGIISGNGSGLTNLPAGALGLSIDSSEITDGSIVNADISASAAIDQSKINGLSAALAAKEAAITAGTSAQYLRGDKTWYTLDTSAVPENANLYFTDTRARSAVSASTPIAYNSTTGVISMAAATSIANGYLSSSDWLSFSGKQDAITAASTLDSGTVTTALQNGVQLKPFGTGLGESGELRFTELLANGTNFVGFKAPNVITADNIWTLPPVDGTNGQALTTNGSGVLGWTSSSGGTVTSVTAGTGLSGGTITGSGTVSLANTAVTAGTYSRANITVDAQGRLTAAANGASVNLASEVTSTLPVANGGTGVTTSTGTGNVVLSNSPTLVTPALGTPASGVATNITGLPLSTGVTGTLPVANGGTGVTTSTGTGNVVLSNSPTLVTPVLGTPASGVATNLTGLPLSTGVTGTLAVANGGTGASTLTLNNVLLGNGTGAPLVVAPGTSGNVLTSNGTTWQSTAIPATTWATPGTIGSTTANTGAFTSLSATSLTVAGTNSTFGVGEGATPTATTIRGAAGAGLNIAGADLTIRASNGTGTGGSGAINFQTAPVAVSSSTANTMATRMTIDKAGNVGIGTTNPTTKLEVNGTVNAKGFQPGTQSLSVTGGATTFALDGSGVVLLTITVGNEDPATISTITGCNSGAVAQGQTVTIIAVTADNEMNFTGVDSGSGSMGPDRLVFGSVSSVKFEIGYDAAQITILCTTISGHKSWIFLHSYTPLKLM